MSRAIRVMCVVAASVLAGCGEVAMKLPGDAAPSDADPSMPPDGGQQLTIKLHKSFPFVDGDTENATFLAVQDGTGAWKTVTGEDGVYRVTLASERYGVAYGCASSTRSSVVVVHQTTRNGLEVRRRSCLPAALQLKVIVQGIPPETRVFVAARGANGTTGPDGSAVLSLNPGFTELFVTLLSNVDGRPYKTVRVPKLDLRDDREITVDVASQGAALEAHPLSVTLRPDEFATISTTVSTDTGDYTLFNGAPLVNDAGAKAFQILPASLRGPADLFNVSVSATSSHPGDLIYLTQGTRTSKAPQTLTIDLLDFVATPTPAIVASPHLRPAYTFANGLRGVPGASYLVNAITLRPSDSVSHGVAISLSSEWLGDAPMVDYIAPDLSGIPGFADNFAPFPRTRISWTVARIEENAVTGDGHVFKQGTIFGSTGEYCGNNVIEPPETCEPPDVLGCSATCTKP